MLDRGVVLLKNKAGGSNYLDMSMSMSMSMATKVPKYVSNIQANYQKYEAQVSQHHAYVFLSRPLLYVSLL